MELVTGKFPSVEENILGLISLQIYDKFDLICDIT